MYYTVIKHSGHLRTLEKCRKHSPAARVVYISPVFSNARRVLSQCNTRLRLLYLLNIYIYIFLFFFNQKHMLDIFLGICTPPPPPSSKINWSTHYLLSAHHVLFPRKVKQWKRKGGVSNENHLAPVVQRVDSAIRWINHYPMDKCYQN